MRLSKLIQAIFAVTLLALIYIHLQMQIYDLAYKGKGKEGQIRELSEANAGTAYKILELKSVNNLGDRLLTQDQKLCFRDNKSIVRLVTADALIPEEKISHLPQPKKENSLLGLLTAKAEARTRLAEGKNLFWILGEDLNTP